MVDDARPEEPNQPSLDRGGLEPGTAPDEPDDDVSSELYRTFWGLVAVFNVGLFATALGTLLLVFGGDTRLSAGLLAIGLVTLAFGVGRFRTHRSRDAEDASTDEMSSERGP